MNTKVDWPQFPWMKFDRANDNIGAVAEIVIGYKREEVNTNWNFTEPFLADDLINENVEDAITDKELLGNDVFVGFRLEIEIDENGNITGKAVPQSIGRTRTESVERFPQDTDFQTAMDTAIMYSVLDSQKESS